MSRIAIAIVVSLAAGFAAAALYLRDNSPVMADPESIDTGDYFDQTAATEQRLRALETVVAEERNVRQLLEEELQFLIAEIERLDTAGASTDEPAEVVGQLNTREGPAFLRDTRRARSPEDRAALLIDAGFSPDEADRIIKREAELQFESMQARFEARRSGTPPDLDANPSAMLRAELGDADYERYLEANNRQTSVGVSRVLESSPGQAAGLQSGDQIVSYAGIRVFDVLDLNRQTLQGTPGESVVVDIVRNGMPMQIVLPRGPIGIQASRDFGRPRTR